MSRFLPDNLFIGIEPDRVALVRLNGQFRKTVATDAVLPVDIRTPAGMQDFGRELASERWQGCRTRIIVADRLLHYFIVNRPQGAQNINEIELAAALRFEDIFDETAKDWEIQLDMPPFAHNFLACAIKRTLIDAVRQHCAKARLTIDTLAPFAIAEWNRVARLASRKDAWFVVAGRQGCWAARRGSGGWLTVRQMQWQIGLQELPQLLRRESVRFALEEGRIDATVVGLTGRNAPGLSDQHALYLWPSALLWRGQSAQWSDIYRFALSPVWP